MFESLFVLIIFRFREKDSIIFWKIKVKVLWNMVEDEGSGDGPRPGLFQGVLRTFTEKEVKVRFRATSTKDNA